MQVEANGIRIEVEDSGGSGPAVLLVMGLGMQLTAWPERLVDGLRQAGYRVFRHDNRDAGLSESFDHCGRPRMASGLLRYNLRLRVPAPYGVADMAADALGVLDALGVARAHLVGASMGGMIAQRMAIAAPRRVPSLTSIMSSSGARGLPGPRPPVVRAMLGRPRAGTREAVMAYYLDFFRAIGSPGFPTPPAQLRAQIEAGLRRAYHPYGALRQTLAVLADTERARELARIRCPTLVVHGRDDPFVPLACGEDTARRIPGARLQVIDGMGHDLPDGVVDRLLPPLLAHLAAASQDLDS